MFNGALFASRVFKPEGADGLGGKAGKWTPAVSWSETLSL